jgi:hypothetical protein
MHSFRVGHILYKKAGTFSTYIYSIESAFRDNKCLLFGKTSLVLFDDVPSAFSAKLFLGE